MEDGLREMTGRELLYRLSRLGAALSGGQLEWHDEDDGPLQDDEEEPSDYEEDDSEAMEAEGEGPNAVPSVAPDRPSSCSFLFPGRTFVGQQRLTGPHRQQEDWAVTATIYSCDFERGRVTGSLVAQNNPHAKRPIVTYFEGDIIDNANHTFWTGAKWGSSPSHETDLRYWSRCPGFTACGLRTEVPRHDGRPPALGSCPYVFMRWKECFFVDVPQDCPLTISGFYYLSLDRTSGAIGGYYHDTRSAPLQVLQLKPLELCGTSSSTAAAVSTSTTSEEAQAGGPGAAAAHDPWGEPVDREPPVWSFRRSSRPSAAATTAPGAAAAAGTAPASALPAAAGHQGSNSGDEVPAGMAFGSYSLC